MEPVDKRAWIQEFLERERLALQVQLDGHYGDVSFKLQQAFADMTTALVDKVAKEPLDTTEAETEGRQSKRLSKQGRSSYRVDKAQNDDIDCNGTNGTASRRSGGASMYLNERGNTSVLNGDQQHILDELQSKSSGDSSAKEEKSMADMHFFHRESVVSEDAVLGDLDQAAGSAGKGGRQRTSQWAHHDIKALLMNRHPAMGHPTSCRGRLYRVLHGPTESIICFLILLNVVATFVGLEELGNRADKSLGLEYWEWPNALLIFHCIETVFTSIFVVELALRIFVYQRWFFKSHLNILDLVVVSITAVDIFILSNLQNSPFTSFKSHEDLASATDRSNERQWLRLIAIVRAARILRTMRHFKELRVILDTMWGSFTAVFWSILLMVIFQWMMAMLLCQALHGFVIDESKDLDSRRWIHKHYGSGFSSLFTLFEATFSGCWPNYFRPLMELVSPWFAFPIAAYVVCVIFTMSRIVSALFIRETLRQASDQAEIMIKERKKETGAITRKLHAIFMAADTSGDGFLTEDETSHILSIEKVRMLLSKLGLEASDGHVLFKMLDDGRGSINRDEFVSGIKHLKGEARSIDLIPLVQDCRRILQNCQAMRSRQEEFLRQQRAVGGHSTCAEALCNQRKELI